MSLLFPIKTQRHIASALTKHIPTQKQMRAGATCPSRDGASILESAPTPGPGEIWVYLPGREELQETGHLPSPALAVPRYATSQHILAAPSVLRVSPIA